MSAQRLPDWRERLAAFVLARRAVPFAWADNNCVLIAADAVAAIAGADIAAPLRGFAPSRFGALLRLRRLGFSSVAEFFDAHFPRVSYARPGDLVCLDDGPLNTTLIADGRGAGWGASATGLMRVALPAQALAWGV